MTNARKKDFQFLTVKCDETREQNEILIGGKEEKEAKRLRIQ